jgi:hypothetical protein
LKDCARARFWQAYERLSGAERELTLQIFKIMKANPRHPSLQLKQIGALQSARVGVHYRTLGVDVEGDIPWFWKGTHREHDELVGNTFIQAYC